MDSLTASVWSREVRNLGLFKWVRARTRNGGKQAGANPPILRTSIRFAKYVGRFDCQAVDSDPACAGRGVFLHLATSDGSGNAKHAGRKFLCPARFQLQTDPRIVVLLLRTRMFEIGA
jgi:hypothetical protein